MSTQYNYENELYDAIQPILEFSGPNKKQEIEENWEQEAPGILSWAVKSGYLLWTRQQPKPLNPSIVFEWLKQHTIEDSWNIVGDTKKPIREIQGEMKKAKSVLADLDLIEALLKLADQEMMPVANVDDLNVRMWAKQSGYLKWARQQPKPLDRNHLQEWLVKNRQKAKFDVVHVNSSKSLLERYQTRNHVWPQEVNYKRIIQNLGHLGLAFINTVGDLSSDRAKKYRFSTSAIDMLTYLMNPENIGDDAYDIPLPSIGVWMELTTPLLTPRGFVAALQFTPFDVLKEVEIAQKRVSLPAHLYNALLRHYQDFVDDLPSHDSWGFHVIAPNGAVFEQWVYSPTSSHGEYGKAGTWKKKGHQCPTCEGIEEEDDGLYCPECCRCFDYYTAMLKTALLMLSGTFAEEDNPIKPTVISEQVISKIPRENNPKKTKVVMKTHQYTMITFDACKKKPRTLVEEPQEKRDSWVETAQSIDPDAIVYVDHHIAKTERTLRSERFINKRGQTIPVRAHDKRIPMKVSELKRKITRVIASKYEQPLNQ